MNSGYSSRNVTQQDVPKMATGLSNKVPVSGNGDNQRSNDYLRLKRVNNMISANATNGNDSTGKAQQK